MYLVCLSALSYPCQQIARSRQIIHLCEDLYCARCTTVALNLNATTSAMLDIDMIVRKKGALIGHNR